MKRVDGLDTFDWYRMVRCCNNAQHKSWDGTATGAKKGQEEAATEFKRTPTPWEGSGCWRGPCLVLAMVQGQKLTKVKVKGIPQNGDLERGHWRSNSRREWGETIPYGPAIRCARTQTQLAYVAPALLAVLLCSVFQQEMCSSMLPVLRKRRNEVERWKEFVASYCHVRHSREWRRRKGTSRTGAAQSTYFAKDKMEIAVTDHGMCTGSSWGDCLPR